MKRLFAVAVVVACASLAACVPASASAYPASWKLPNHRLTPGVVAAGYGLKDICPHVNPKLEAARPSYAEKVQVYREYGVTHHVTGQYEVDHSIPIELLGSPSSIRNLWPEPNDKANPATIKAEHLNPAYIENSKDILEDVLHRDVCDGQVRLSVAQKAISTDWRAAYVKYVGKPSGGGTVSSKPWCKATASPANDGYSGDYDVHVTSNQPGKDATASDAGDKWSRYTSSTGAATIRLWHQSAGETIKVTVGGAACWAKA
jgi:hypothetical protein